MYVELSGLMVYPGDNKNTSRVISMCYLDTIKPYTAEGLKVLDNACIESATTFKKGLLLLLYLLHAK